MSPISTPSAGDELNYLFQEMLGELTVGHLFVGGGDTPEVKHVMERIAGRRLHDRKRPLSFRATSTMARTGILNSRPRSRNREST